MTSIGTTRIGTSNFGDGVWFGALILCGAFFSLVFACAAPFAAFAAIAALTTSKRKALLVTAAIWLGNQAVGYAVLHYPLDLETALWGGALGAVALLCCAATRFVLHWASGASAPAAALLASFLVYEGTLYALTRAVGGDTAHYALASVARIFVINAGVFAALWIVDRARMGFGRKLVAV